MKSKAGKVLAYGLAILILIYMGLVIALNLWDKFQAHDWFGFALILYLYLWIFISFIPWIRSDLFRKTWSWVALFIGMSLIKIIETIFTRSSSDLAFALSLMGITMILAYRKRNLLFRKS